MNDFTRFELTQILVLLGVECKGTPIFKKIEGMIQNYCEHKSLEMDCDGGISLVCTDCNHTVMDI